MSHNCLNDLMWGSVGEKWANWRGHKSSTHLQAPCIACRTLELKKIKNSQTRMPASHLLYPRVLYDCSLWPVTCRKKMFMNFFALQFHQAVCDLDILFWPPVCSMQVCSFYTYRQSASPFKGSFDSAISSCPFLSIWHMGLCNTLLPCVVCILFSV